MPAAESRCPNCLKPEELCVCSEARPFKTRLHVLILQHPQEPDKDLGSARLAHLCLPNSTLRIGLSWPNLKAALGKDFAGEVVPGRWAVLYLGSGVKREGAPHGPGHAHRALELVDKKGVPLANADQLLAQLDGLVVLDGTWSQAKALWWRNAWLLKLRRAILQSKRKSLYRELRKEPRRECLSTIESIAEALEGLGEPPEAAEELRAIFGALLNRQRARLKARRAAANFRG